MVCRELSLQPWEAPADPRLQLSELLPEPCGGGFAFPSRPPHGCPVCVSPGDKILFMALIKTPCLRELMPLYLGEAHFFLSPRRLSYLHPEVAPGQGRCGSLPGVVRDSCWSLGQIDLPQRGPWKLQREAASCFLTTFITFGRSFVTKFSGILFPHHSWLQISKATLKTFSAQWLWFSWGSRIPEICGCLSFRS